MNDDNDDEPAPIKVIKSAGGASSAVAGAAADAATDAVAGAAAAATDSLTVLIQTGVTFVAAPMALFWLFTIMTDIMVNRVGTCEENEVGCHKWAFGGLHFFVLIVFPALSFWGSCYMLIQYWMDEKSWTLLRKRVMFANIPMCIFFALILMGQSEFHRMGMNCAAMGYLLQITYLMMNLWHTMTIITAYRFICLEKGKLKGSMRFIVHIICWGFPIVSTTVLTIIEPSVYHDDIFSDPDIRGMGWCGVKSSYRLLKAVFVNSPQLISVSLYAQYYSYIHDYIDPKPNNDPSSAASSKISTSKNAALMGASVMRKEEYTQDLARQLRLYMTAYMMSFLTNTVMQVVGDNMAKGLPSDSNLLIQAVVVTPQGFIWSLVYMQSAPNSLFSAYCNVAVKFFESRGNRGMVDKIKSLNEASKQATQASTSKPGAVGRFVNSLILFMQSFLMMPVAIWVWTPMEFLAEQLKSRAWVFFGLCVWGVATVFPIYWFSVGFTFADPRYYSFAAQAYVIVVIVISAWAVWNNRYAHYLTMIEAPVRRVGVFSSIGQGYRLNSVRNVMGLFTLFIEFSQVFNMAWKTAKMKDQYQDYYAVDDADGSADGKDLGNRAKSLGTFWIVVGLCGVWTVFYSLPAVITTSTVGNQKLAFELSEKYRKILWFLSGAGFLTVLKALMAVIFCLPDPMGNLDASGEVRQVVLTDYNLVCWSQDHLRMTAIALICLILFFPSASLTCLFRYGDEDDRYGMVVPFCAPTKYCIFKNGINNDGGAPGIVLGGEDTRWIHIWKRAEYMVKGIWVFSAFKFSTYGLSVPPLIILLCGSFLIAWMNWFMAPANLSYVGRVKLNVHVCNVWTTTTCLWAITTENTDATLHFTMLWSGWVFVWICIFGYEALKFKKDVFRQPVGDQENIDNCFKDIERLEAAIASAKSLQKWGVHAKIVRLMRFCEHEDNPVRKAAYTAMAKLAYQDQMTTDRSFFLSLTPTDPVRERPCRSFCCNSAEGSCLCLWCCRGWRSSSGRSKRRRTPRLET